ncbi:hypothetical protein N7510_002180 [Penicillium lagena]|uniref:uncharacterized protein n=1 Tax=Penicillium lagena TaxID=94218 RepID=UPI0025403ECA|nr:uncharacterized protein N7510_002180 [Penicillium lagena]KAJ5625871.1 hypothetical protein N7510_002180 [Penicillium lagena]
MWTSYVRATTLCWVLGSLFTEPSSAQVIYEDLDLVPKYLKAHAIVMGLVFTVMLPLGVFAIRFLKGKNAVLIHAGWQLFSWVLIIAGLGCGIRVGKILDRLENNPHTIIGTTVVVLMLLQPFIGLAHHLRFRKTKMRTAWTRIHVWYGRALILLGIINGGLGLKLAANTTKGKIAYGVVGGIFGMGIIVIAALFETEILTQWTQSKTAPELGMAERTEQQQEHA